MRLPTFLALLLCCPCSLAAEGIGNFSGAWVAWLCPAGIQNDPGKCSNFALELFQKQDKLCGTHVFATAGAGRLDEGAAPSLTGTVAGDTATVMVVSVRAAPPVQLRVELKRAKDSLRWQRLDSPAGDYLLPLFAQLTKSRHGTLLSPVFEQKLRAVCSSMSNTAVENGASPVSGTPR